MKTIRKITLCEWSEETLSLELTSDDRVLLQQFRNGAANGVRIEELRNSVRIQTKSSIGVIRLDSIEIRIEPKLAGSDVRVVEMLEYTSGLDLLRKFKHSHHLIADSDNLFDLIVMLLVTETEHLIRNGLLSSYREEEDVLPVVRGRLLGDRQLLLRFGMLDKIHCRFDDLSQNIVENQLLAVSLASCEALIGSDELRHRLRKCIADLLSCCEPTSLNLEQAKVQLTYDRLNQHYRSAHELCWLVLERIGIRDFHRAGSTRCFSFLLNMNQLYEQFVAKLVRQLLRPHRMQVISQHSDPSIIRNALTNQPYAKVIPDLIVQSPIGKRLCVDAKYKLYDELKVSNSDIYQLFLYAYAIGGSPDHRLAALMYPSCEVEGRTHRLKINGSDSRPAFITAIGFHIPSVLDELRARAHSPPTGGLLRELTLSILEAGNLPHGLTERYPPLTDKFSM